MCTLMQVRVLHASGDADIVVFMHKNNDSRNSWSHYESEGVGEQFFLRYPDVYKLWEGYTKLSADESSGTQNYVVIPNVM